VDAYSRYSDDIILKQWASVIPPEHILMLEDPKAIVDVLLGALAILEGTRKLDGYLADMKSRNQTEERIQQTERALRGLGNVQTLGNVEGSIPVPPAGAMQRGGRSKRIG
jgi:hypothetical protein